MTIEIIDKATFNVVKTVKEASSVHDLAMERENLDYRMAALQGEIGEVQARMDELDGLIKEATSAGFVDEVAAAQIAPAPVEEVKG